MRSSSPACRRWPGRRVSELPRIPIAISSLGGGGAQRTAVNVANHWAAAGRAVTVATLYHGDAPSAFALDARVARIDAGLRQRGSRSEADVRAAIGCRIAATPPRGVLSLVD